MKRWLVAGGAVLVVGGIAGIVWFQPHKLVVEETVDEDVPVAVATRGPATPALPATPAVLSRSAFRELTHPTSGNMVVLRLEDGSRVVRFEDFETSNGPDIVVWLSTAPADAEGRAYAEDFLDLGALKGNKGNQNYTVPADVDLSKYRSVVIWCRRFTVPFASAPLATA